MAAYDSTSTNMAGHRPPTLVHRSINTPSVFGTLDCSKLVGVSTLLQSINSTKRSCIDRSAYAEFKTAVRLNIITIMFHCAPRGGVIDPSIDMT